MRKEPCEELEPRNLPTPACGVVCLLVLNKLTGAVNPALCLILQAPVHHTTPCYVTPEHTMMHALLVAHVLTSVQPWNASCVQERSGLQGGLTLE